MGRSSIPIDIFFLEWYPHRTGAVINQEKKKMTGLGHRSRTPRNQKFRMTWHVSPCWCPMKDRAWGDSGKRGRSHQIVPILKATTVCLAKGPSVSGSGCFLFYFPRKHRHVTSGLGVAGTMQSKTSSNEIYITRNKNTLQNAGQTGLCIHVHTFTLLLKCSSPFAALKCSSPFAAHHQHLLAHTKHMTIQHICAATGLFVLSGDQLDSSI